ncbi:MAG: hypothetical protein U5L45_15285 [Saprospiraceae bacterium]|nr:hypothetical protein [Saprospiraceae bacterium]
MLASLAKKEKCFVFRALPEKQNTSPSFTSEASNSVQFKYSQNYKRVW